MTDVMSLPQAWSPGIGRSAPSRTWKPPLVLRPIPVPGVAGVIGTSVPLQQLEHLVAHADSTLRERLRHAGADGRDPVQPKIGGGRRFEKHRVPEIEIALRHARVTGDELLHHHFRRMEAAM